MKFQCPECGALPHKHGKGACDAEQHQRACDGFICECFAEGDDHGESFSNVCTEAVCTHCGWVGEFPKKPKGLQAWEKKAIEAGWTPPKKRAKELKM